MAPKQQAMKLRDDSVYLLRALNSTTFTQKTGTILASCPCNRISALRNQYLVHIRLRTCHLERCMARRPSTVSVASLASSRAPLESLRSPGAASVLSPSATKISRTISQFGSLASSKSQDDVVDIEPDELFAKYTIVEVKARQAQLRYSVSHSY